LLAKKVGRGREVDEITRHGICGRIGFRVSLERRISLLKGVDYRVCVEAAEAIQLNRGALQLIESLRRLTDVKIGTITGGFSILAERVKERLSLDFAVSNELVFNAGRLSGVRVIVGEDKHVHMLSLAREFGISMSNTIAVGDGANDVGMVRAAGLGIGFNAVPVLKKHAKISVNAESLMALYPPIEEFVQKRLRIDNGWRIAGSELVS